MSGIRKSLSLLMLLGVTPLSSLIADDAAPVAAPVPAAEAPAAPATAEAAVPAAAEVASPIASLDGIPTLRQRLRNPAAGDFAKYRKTDARGVQSQTLTMWHVFSEIKDDKQLILTAWVTNRATTSDEPPTVTANDMRNGALTLPLDNPFLEFSPNAGVNIVSRTVTDEPSVELKVGDTTWTCRKLTVTTAVKAGAIEATYTQTAWLNDKVPVLGIVRLREAWTGGEQSSSDMELIACSTTYERGTTEWFMDRAEKGARASLLATYNNAAPASYQLSKFARFQAVMADAYGRMNRMPEGLALLSKIKDSTYSSSARQRLLATAGFTGDESSVEALMDDEDEVDQLIGMWSGQFFVNSPGLAKALSTETILAKLPLIARQEEPGYGLASALATLYQTNRADAALQGLSGLTPVEVRDATVVRLMDNAVELHPDLAFADRLWQAYPTLQTNHTMLRRRMETLLNTGKKDEARALVDSWLAAREKAPPPKISDIDILPAETDLLWRLGDARAQTVYRQGMQRRLDALQAELQPKLDKGETISDWQFASVAEAAAGAGDLDLAQQALSLMPKGAKSYNYVSVLTNLYKAGKVQEARALVEKLPLDQADQPFFSKGNKAAILYNFARHDRLTGNEAGYKSGMDTALELSLAADSEMVAYNKAHSGSMVGWGGYFSLIDRSTVTFVVIMRDLIEAGDLSRALAIVARTESHQPYSNSRTDLWKYFAVETALHGNAALLKEVLAAMPDDSKNNNMAARRLAMQALTYSGHGDAATEIAMGTENVALRIQYLNLIAIELADLGKIDDAIKAREAAIGIDKSLGNLSLVNIAIARALAKAGKPDEARTVFMSTYNAGANVEDDYAFNERPYSTVLLETAWYAGLAGMKPADLADWCDQLPKGLATAYFSLGATLGIGGVPVEGTFNNDGSRRTLNGF